MDINKRLSVLWKRYENGLNYFKNSGLEKEWEEAENFYEGRHWPQATERTKNMPRPIVNLCSMIADNKKASILSSNPKMIFRTSEVYIDSVNIAEEGASKFSKFTEGLLKELKQTDLDDLAQESATQLGTYIYHYYWDSNVSGGIQTPYVGAVRGEILYPKNVIFSNPAEKDEQKQKYIIIVSTEDVETVKKLSKENGIKNYSDITADNENIDEEFKDKEVCTVLTQYSRINGHVVWEKATKNAYIQEPTLWEPNKESIKLNYIEDLEEPKEPDNVLREVLFTNQLYPVVVSSHKRRKKSIYGIGEITQAIPNNKAVNFNLGMMLLAVQQTAWPKIIAKAGALAKQIITNTPGEIVIDNSKSGGFGIQYMQTPNVNPQVTQITSTLIDLTRSTSGSTEVATGEVIGANMAASAIIALQNQAKKPIEMYQKNFYRTYEKIGNILLQFFKYYYTDNRLFSYEDDGERIINYMNGSKYKDINYSLIIEVGASGAYSESLTISLLDQLKAAGDITTDDYIELYPESIMTFKQKLKRMREKKLIQQQLIMQTNNQNPIE